MPHRFLSSAFSAATVSLAFALLSSAASAQALPSTVDAGRVRQDIDKQIAPKSINTPEDLSTTPDVKAPVGAEKITLVLRDVNVVGAKKVPNTEVAQAYQHLIGKKITLVDVYAIANRITKIYRDHGYILSRAIVPKQEISNGVVKIQVVEGFVSAYNLQVAPDIGLPLQNQIRAFADKLVGSGTLSAKNLERYLLLMNDLPGVKVRSILAPSQSVVGGADMTLVVEQDKFNGLASVDNFGNSYLGPVRATLGGQFNSLFGSSDQINLTGLVAPDHDELRYISTGIRHNIGSEGTKAGMNLSYTVTDPSLPDDLGGLLEPEGQSFTLGFAVDHPFIRSRSFNVTGGLGFDITNNKTNYAPGLAAIETEDGQRIARANGQVTYLDGFAGYNIINASVSQGLEIFGSSEEGDSNLSRAEGDPGFTKFNIDATRLQRLYGPFTALFGISAQASNDPLLASEEFGFGGSDYGRGYDSSEITGDDGVAGKIELAYSGILEKKYLNDYQVYTFYDIGKVWNQDPGAGGDDSDSAASVGVGTRMTFTSYLKGDAFVAAPLTHDVPSRGDHDQSLRFKFSLTSNF